MWVVQRKRPAEEELDPAHGVQRRRLTGCAPCGPPPALPWGWPAGGMPDGACMDMGTESNPAVGARAKRKRESLEFSSPAPARKLVCLRPADSAAAMWAPAAADQAMQVDAPLRDLELEYQLYMLERTNLQHSEI